MRLKKNYVTLAFSILVYFSVPTKALSGPPAYFKDGRASLDVASQYFMSDENYDSDGNATPLAGSNKFSDWATTFDGTYFFSQNWAISGGLNFVQATSNGMIEDRTAGNLTDLHTTLMSSLTFGAFRFIPDLRIRFALDEVKMTADDVLTSEGVNTYQGGSWAVANLNIMKLYAYLGYQYRDDGRSNLLPWTLGASSRYRRLRYAGELNGYKSIVDDGDTNDTFAEFSRLAYLSTVNAGSLRYYGINPSSIEAKIHLNYIWSGSFNFGGWYSQTISGENSAKGQTVGFQLAYNFDQIAFVRPVDEPAAEFNPSLEEDYDESLFQE